MVSVGGICLPVMGRCLVMLSDTSARKDYLGMLGCVASSVCVFITTAVLFRSGSPIFLIMIWGGMFGLTCLLLECRRLYLEGRKVCII